MRLPLVAGLLALVAATPAIPEEVRLQIIEGVGEFGAVNGIVVIEANGLWIETPLSGSQDESSMARWLFNTGSVAEARASAQKRLTEHLERIDAVAPLSPARYQKLELAGRGDINRTLQECLVLWRAASRGAASRDAANPTARLNFLRTSFRVGLHGKDSLLRKAMRAMLSDDEFETACRTAL